METNKNEYVCISYKYEICSKNQDASKLTIGDLLIIDFDKEYSVLLRGRIPNKAIFLLLAFANIEESLRNSARLRYAKTHNEVCLFFYAIEFETQKLCRLELLRTMIDIYLI